MKNVTVCICTYQRNDMLRQTLESLIAQEFTEAVRVKVVVVDNDPTRLAESVVTEYAERNHAMTFVYDCEARTNISHARNKALSHADTDFVAMMDDDEIAPPHWLQTMLNTSDQFDADIVISRVRPIYPKNATQWIIDGGFHDRPDFEHGREIWWGHCGNCLIRQVSIKRDLLSFDESYGLSGGEDSKLFFDLYRAGYKMVWGQNAEITEHVHPNRLTVKWIVNRNFRGGQNFARVYLPQRSVSYLMLWLVKRVISIIGLALMVIPSLFMGKIFALKCFARLVSNIGQLSSPFSIFRLRTYS